MDKFTIFIADDHPIFLHGLKTIIDGQNNFKVSNTASDGVTAWDLIQVNKPSIAILDVDMPGMTGIEISRRVKELGLDTKVIILTMHKDEAVFNLALDMGAMAYVLKDNAATDLVNSINTVLKGEYFISPHIIGFYNNRKQGKYHDIVTAINILTDTEKKVLRMISANKSSKEIASDFFISDKTVQNHRFNICKKLDLEGVNSLLSFALQNKYLINVFLAS